MYSPLLTYLSKCQIDICVCFGAIGHIISRTKTKALGNKFFFSAFFAFLSSFGFILHGDLAAQIVETLSVFIEKTDQKKILNTRPAYSMITWPGSCPL